MKVDCYKVLMPTRSGMISLECGLSYVKDEFYPGLSNLLVSLGHTGRRTVVLGHTLNTQTLIKTKKNLNVLSKFTISCWVAFIATVGCMRPMGHRLDTPSALKLSQK